MRPREAFQAQPRLYRYSSRRVHARAFAIATVVLAGVSTATLSLPAGAVGSKQPSLRAATTTKVVKPDFAYFAGKTIDLLSGGAPGGSDYEFSVITAPLMASYLHCTINVVATQQSAAVPEQNNAAAAPPNGLTIGELAPTGDITDDVVNIPNVDFPVQQVPLIGGPPPPATLVVVSPSSGFKTIGALLGSKSPFNDVDLATGVTNVMTRVLFGAYGSKAKIITGYPNSVSVLSGFLRGDGNVMIAAVSTTQSEILGGVAVPLLQATPPVKGSSLYPILKRVPTLAEYYADHKPSTAAGRIAMSVLVQLLNTPNYILFAPKGTPQPYVLALTDAFRSAMAQKSAQAEFLNLGLPYGYLSPAENEALIKAEIKHAPVLARYL